MSALTVKGQIQRWVACGVLICFLASLCPEAHATLPSLEMAAGKAETPRILNIDIPMELASVDEWYQASAKSKPKLIVHIQDAHANYEAQTKIRDVIKHLNLNYGFKTILVEGAASELDPNILKLFPDHERNVKLADELAKIGEVTGAEMFLIENSDVAKGVGIEKPELYRKNFDALQKVYSEDEFVVGFFDAHEKKLGQIASRSFSPRMIQTIAEWRKFESGHRDFLPFVSNLAELSKKVLEIDLGVLYSQIEWPQMTRLLVLQRIEKELDQGKQEAVTTDHRLQMTDLESSGLTLKERALIEKKQIIDLLKNVSTSPVPGTGSRNRIPEPGRLIEALEKFDEKTANLNRIGSSEVRQASAPRALMETLVEEGGKVGFNIRDYPAFAKYAGYLILRSEIVPSDLFDEIKKLFDLILESLVKIAPSAATEAPDGLAARKRLLLLHRDEILARKLLKLELTHDEWLAVIKRQERFYPDDLNRRMLEQLGQNTRTQEMSKEKTEKMKKLNEAFLAAFAFYSAAVNRDTFFFQRVQEVLKHEDKAILVTGGFHAEGMKYFFRKYDINYGTLTPRITQNFSNEQYRKVMMIGITENQEPGTKNQVSATGADTSTSEVNRSHLGGGVGQSHEPYRLKETEKKSKSQKSKSPQKNYLGAGLLSAATPVDDPKRAKLRMETARSEARKLGDAVEISPNMPPASISPSAPERARGSGGAVIFRSEVKGTDRRNFIIQGAMAWVLSMLGIRSSARGAEGNKAGDQISVFPVIHESEKDWQAIQEKVAGEVDAMLKAGQTVHYIIEGPVFHPYLFSMAYTLYESLNAKRKNNLKGAFDLSWKREGMDNQPPRFLGDLPSSVKRRILADEKLLSFSSKELLAYFNHLLLSDDSLAKSAEGAEIRRALKIIEQVAKVSEIYKKITRPKSQDNFVLSSIQKYLVSRIKDFDDAVNQSKALPFFGSLADAMAPFWRAQREFLRKKYSNEISTGRLVVYHEDYADPLGLGYVDIHRMIDYPSPEVSVRAMGEPSIFDPQMAMPAILFGAGASDATRENPASRVDKLVHFAIELSQFDHGHTVQKRDERLKQFIQSLLAVGPGLSVGVVTVRGLAHLRNMQKIFGDVARNIHWNENIISPEILKEQALYEAGVSGDGKLREQVSERIKMSMAQGLIAYFQYFVAGRFLQLPGRNTNEAEEFAQLEASYKTIQDQVAPKLKNSPELAGKVLKETARFFDEYVAAMNKDQTFVGWKDSKNPAEQKKYDDVLDGGVIYAVSRALRETGLVDIEKVSWLYRAIQKIENQLNQLGLQTRFKLTASSSKPGTVAISTSKASNRGKSRFEARSENRLDSLREKMKVWLQNPINPTVLVASTGLTLMAVMAWLAPAFLVMALPTLVVVVVSGTSLYAIYFFPKMVKRTYARSAVVASMAFAVPSQVAEVLTKVTSSQIASPVLVAQPAADVATTVEVLSTFSSVEDALTAESAKTKPDIATLANLTAKLVDLAGDINEVERAREFIRALRAEHKDELNPSQSNNLIMKVAQLAVKLNQFQEAQKLDVRDEVVVTAKALRKSILEVLIDEEKAALRSLKFEDLENQISNINDLSPSQVTAILIAGGFVSENDPDAAKNMVKLASLAVSRVAPQQNSRLSEMLRSFFPEMFNGAPAKLIQVLNADQWTPEQAGLTKLYLIRNPGLQLRLFIKQDSSKKEIDYRDMFDFAKGQIQLLSYSDALINSAYRQMDKGAGVFLSLPEDLDSLGFVLEQAAVRVNYKDFGFGEKAAALEATIQLAQAGKNAEVDGIEKKGNTRKIHKGSLAGLVEKIGQQIMQMVKFMQSA